MNPGAPLTGEQMMSATKPKEWSRKPRVGDSVHLNDYGLEQCFGHTLGLAPMKKVVYTLSHVDSESITSPEITYPVEVTDPELNSFLIDHICFDLIEPQVCDDCGCDISKFMQEHKPRCRNFPL